MDKVRSHSATPSSRKLGIVLSQHDHHVVQEHVRLLKGLKVTKSPRKKKIVTEKPIVAPRTNETFRRRYALQKHRQRLKTCFPLETDLEKMELEKLRRLATETKRYEKVESKNNVASSNRFKYARGEPILTSKFEAHFDDYKKPPFALNLRAPSTKNLPPAEKNELWFFPVYENEIIPLHSQPKSVVKDKRGKREQMRPPLREHKRIPVNLRYMYTYTEEERPLPWNFGALKTQLSMRIYEKLRSGVIVP